MKGIGAEFFFFGGREFAWGWGWGWGWGAGAGGLEDEEAWAFEGPCMIDVSLDSTYVLPGALIIRTLGAFCGADGRGGRIAGDEAGGCVVGIPKTDMAAGSKGRGVARGALGGALLPGKRALATYI